MPILDQILTEIGQKAECELSSASDISSLAVARGRASDMASPVAARTIERLETGQASAPIYQISPFPLSLNLKEYRDAWSGSNPDGDPDAAYRFQQLVDPIPGLAREYSGSSSIERVYGQIIQGASVSPESLYVTRMLAEAKRRFDADGQSNLVTHDEWRIVEAIPNDWYTDDLDRYSWLELPLDDFETKSSSISLFGNPSELMLTLGDQGQVPLSGATNLKRCRLQHMFVRFNRPWMDFELFDVAGWWLAGQSAGYCSSGRSDVNGGVFPLITTGMIIARSIEFEGWDSTDQARIAKAQDAGQDVYVGPFRLSKPSEAVSSVNVVAWRSELVPFSPQSPGSVRVLNRGKFIAKCVVTWKLNGKQRRAGKLTVGASRTVDIPSGASNIIVRILVGRGGEWSTAYRQRFETPPSKHLVIRGTLRAPKVVEKP